MKNRYALSIEASKRVRWDIDTDVIRGRAFDLEKKYLPDALSLAGRFETLTRRSACSSARSRAAPTPTCSAWWSASSAPRSWK